MYLWNLEVIHFSSGNYFRMIVTLVNVLILVGRGIHRQRTKPRGSINPGNFQPRHEETSKPAAETKEDDNTIVSYVFINKCKQN